MNMIPSPLVSGGRRRSAAGLILAAAVLAAGAGHVLAQPMPDPPERMTYQGFLVDGNGVALGHTAPKNYDVIFRIYDHETASASANVLWGEQQTVTVDKGYFSVLLGEGAEVTGVPRPALSTLFRGATASERFVGITVKGIGAQGANVDIQPRLRLLTSPYAFLARNAVSAANLVNAASAPVVSIADTRVGINNPSPSAALDVVGSVRTDNLEVQDKLTAKEIHATDSLYFDAAGTAYLQVKSVGGGLNPVINFDGNDWLMYDRARDEYVFHVNSASRLQVTGSGINVPAPNVISGYGTIPVGGIIMWSGTAVPDGWRLCDGGTSFGVTTPDLRGRFVLGAGTGSGLTPRSIGQTDGEETHLLKVEEMPAHTHKLRVFYANFDHLGSASEGSPRDDGDGSYEDADAVKSAGGGLPHNTMPPYYVLAYIMRVR